VKCKVSRTAGYGRLGAMESLLHEALPPPETEKCGWARQWWAFWGLVDDDRRVWVGPETK
jgi:hypothetical protein